MRFLFTAILNMSLTASVVILFVLLVRLCLGRAPKVFSYALWGVVLFRLLCPVSVSMPVSLLAPMSDVGVSVGTDYTAVMEYITLPEQPQYAYEELTQSDAGNTGTAPNAAAAVAEPQHKPVTKTTLTALSWIWGIGVIAVLGVTLLRTARLRRVLADACVISGNIFESEKIDKAFILGALRPKIYLPIGLPEEVREPVIAHERAHQRRADHIVKLVAYIALALHWFNPLVWLAFRVMCDDMEKSCDETAVRAMIGSGYTEKRAKAMYCSALVSMECKSKFEFSPVFFGEHNIIERVKNVTKQKKTTRGAIIAICCLIAAAAILCIANPRNMTQELSEPISVTVRSQEDVDAMTAMTSVDNMNLTIGGEEQLDFSGISAMKKLRRLFVDFEGYAIPPEYSMFDIGDGDPEEENPNIDLFFAQIGNIPNLKELRCGSQNGWKVKGVSEYLKELTELESLVVVLHRSETSVDFIKEMDRLTSLLILGQHRI